MKRTEQWNYAITLLENFGIKATNNVITFTGNGRDLIIHSKQLCNCIQISRNDDKEDIFKKIQMQIKIALKKRGFLL